jgi:hypothetical protein
VTVNASAISFLNENSDVDDRITSMITRQSQRRCTCGSVPCDSAKRKSQAVTPGAFEDFSIKVTKKRNRPSPAIKLWSETSAPVVYRAISWLGYRPIDHRARCEDLFCGVIHHIHSNSDRHYNRAELTVEYSSRAPGSDPSAIFDAASSDVFESGAGPNACLAVTFHRIRVRPSALAVQSGRWTGKNAPVWCFVFQGWDPRARKWVVLNERRNEFRPWINAKGYVIDTEFAFRKFRFLYTGAVSIGVSCFSLRAFEIHGTVFPDEKEAGWRGASAGPWGESPGSTIVKVN